MTWKWLSLWCLDHILLFLYSKYHVTWWLKEIKKFLNIFLFFCNSDPFYSMKGNEYQDVFLIILTSKVYNFKEMMCQKLTGNFSKFSKLLDLCIYIGSKF